MRIHPVTSKHDLKRFIHLPYHLYKNDPVWVPPLLSELYNQFSAKHNPTLDHIEYSLFILEDNGKVTGRIAAFIDRLALETWKEPVGLFGYYECIDNLLYRALYESLYSPDTWVEINYVLEDNTMMNNAIIKLNAKPMRRYRVYEKKI